MHEHTPSRWLLKSQGYSQPNTPVKVKLIEQQALQGLQLTRSLWMGVCADPILTHVLGFR